ncbi:MAG: GDP-mannose 4,6-dehydratase [Parcubacteria group bacterium]|nr:GDP-mannose 4,6-dehydratase [Parcubacteria group bacterium]
MTILVTGGAGFIGFHLIRALLEGGHRVVSIDNMNQYYDPSLKEARLSLIRDAITFYRGDITDKVLVDRIFTEHRIDTICHLAAQAGVRYSLENPYAYTHSNVLGTLTIFEAAKKHGVNHILFASTSSVYGLNSKIPFHEDDRVDMPISIYAASKRACELLGFTYHHLFGINTTCLRFFTVYGPYGRPDMALFTFTKGILEGKPIPVYNHGDMERDFTYVADIVQGFLQALDRPLGYMILNLGNGHPVRLMDFIRVIEEKLGEKAEIEFLPMQPGDVQRTFADISKARQLLAFNPKISVAEGVGKFVDWYSTYYGASRAGNHR